VVGIRVSAIRAGGGPLPAARSATGMVTANHHLAARVGADVLAAGGNAVDAAVAVSFALGVVEPAMSGIGGRGYLLVMPPGASQPTVFDGHERAPFAATADMFTPTAPAHTAGWGLEVPVSDELNRTGPLAAATPGLLAALAAAHEEFGTVPLPSLVRPAQELAREGFEVDPYLANLTASNAGRLARYDATADLFLPAGKPLEAGVLLVQADLANTLGMLARDGLSALYDGALGQAIAAHVTRLGGVLRVQDLEAVRVRRWPTPLTTTFLGHHVYGLPGPTGSVTVAQVLGILEGFPDLLVDEPGADYLEVLLGACRLGYLDRYDYLSDGHDGPTPFGGLLAKGYLAQLRTLVARAPAPVGVDDRPDPWRWQRGTSPRPMPLAAGGDAHTTHFCVVDADGAAVSMTQSLIDEFGSCVTVPGTGVLLNSAMHNFVPMPGHHGSVGPGRRSVHNGSPLVVTGTDGRLRLTIGGAGGTRIVTGLAQVLVDVIARGRDVQSALSSPRVHNEAGTTSEVDARFGTAVIDELALRGHHLTARAPSYGYPVSSRINGIELTAQGIRRGGFDPYVPSGAAWTDLPPADRH
jgi:gamma-glutamyltranspeptidase / glutathione hydrolase